MPERVSGNRGKRPWGTATRWLLFLGPFFFLSYGLTNWLASRRADVGSLVFDWEQQIPFVAWTVIPYWSIDFLYAASLFVCATRAELHTHARRLLAAQVIAVTCFLLFPLRFTFPRPEIDGAFGALFDLLAGFDKPFNQAPSLHIALLVILWSLYLRQTRGVWRAAVHGWFALIGVSVLTTWQHHFIDLPSGVWVGLLCLWLFPDGAPSPLAGAALTRSRRRRSLAWRYGVAAFGVGALALLLGGWGVWLLWAAGSLALVAAAYAGLGEATFQKNMTGALSPAARWLLAPYILAAWINARWWTRSMAAADEVLPGLRLGRLPTRGELAAQGMPWVVDLTAELPGPLTAGRYTSLPQLDLVPPTAAQLHAAAQAIDAALHSPPVLVCCALGLSRSAAAVAAWLIASGRAGDAGEALSLIRRARPGVVLEGVHLTALQAFAGGSGEVAGETRQ